MEGGKFRSIVQTKQFFWGARLGLKTTFKNKRLGRETYDFMLKSIGASCDERRGGECVDVFVAAIFSPREMVVADACDDVDEWRFPMRSVGCGDIGGVIETTISSLSMSSSSLLFCSFGEHCDFSTASKYRLVSSSADLLVVLLLLLLLLLFGTNRLLLLAMV